MAGSLDCVMDALRPAVEGRRYSSDDEFDFLLSAPYLAEKGTHSYLEHHDRRSEEFFDDDDDEDSLRTYSSESAKSDASSGLSSYSRKPEAVFASTRGDYDLQLSTHTEVGAKSHSLGVSPAVHHVFPEERNRRTLRVAPVTLPFWWRLLLIIVANVATFLVAGPVFGVPVLSATLLEEGLFTEGCQEAINVQTDTSNLMCGSQANQLALVFMLGASCFWVSVGPALCMVAFCGPLWSSSIGVALATIGMSLLATVTTRQALLPAVLLLGLGGPVVVLSFLHLTNLFPANKGVLLTLFSVTTDASTVVFSLVALGGRYDWRGLCVVHACMTAGLLLLGIFLWGSESTEETPPPVPPLDLLDLDSFHSSRSSSMVPAVTSPRSTSDLVTFRLAGESVSAQLLSPAFLMGAVFFVVHMLRNSVFYATSYFQLILLVTGTTEAHDWMIGLGVLLPLVGVLFVPSTGWLLRQYPLWFNIVLLNVGALLFSLLLLVPWLPCLILAMALFFVLRSHLFWVMTNYFATLFGCRNFRVLWSVVFGATGVLNMIIVWPVVRAVLSQVPANDTHSLDPRIEWQSLNHILFRLNAHLSILILFLFLFPVWLVCRRRHAKKFVDLDVNDPENRLLVSGGYGKYVYHYRASYGYSQL
eukprot:gb/GEZN01003622.1/.p1 GENE.gb/GEZN01003622.1/~~gb/GEZN01003622.1/.p1  ORF type:complete len:644 (+),score=56.70 gb/GEZN01003622.1/:52-1983(+)